MSNIERGFGLCDTCERELRDVQATAADHDCALCAADIAGHEYVDAPTYQGAVEDNERLREALDWIYTEPEDALKVQMWARAALDGKPNGGQ